MNNGLAAIIIGSLAVLYGIYGLIRMLSSRHWAEAKGVIIRSVRERRSTDMGEVEDADIEYEYSVNGQVYRSKGIAASGDISSVPSKVERTEVDKLLARYPEGSTVAVYYHPNVPQLACLEKGTFGTLLIPFILGTLAIIAGYLL